MHTTAIVQEIDRLLQDRQLSQRQIAALLGVSRSTVSAIASGRRDLYGKEPHQTHVLRVPATPPARCPHCGYRVYMPCIICRTREREQRQRYLRLIVHDAQRRA
jgi:transcriptional regulator with XRE-family HTH domain